jgi:DNA-binding MarR family transcriptional regulator
MKIDFKDKSFKQKYKFLAGFSSIFNNLTPKEIDTLALVLDKQHLSSFMVLDQTEMRKSIIEELQVTPAYFNNIISSLRRKNVLEGNKLTKVYEDLMLETEINITL